jgi:hypothetical protein
MLQLALMVLGVVYVFKLIGLNGASANLALPSDAVAQWKRERTRQYVWGIVAGWGSFAISYIVFTATLDPNGYATESDLLAAETPGLLVGFAILVIGIVLSVMAGKKAKAIEKEAIDPDTGLSG